MDSREINYVEKWLLKKFLTEDEDLVAVKTLIKISVRDL